MPPAPQPADTAAFLPTVLLSIKPLYADLIEQGLKLVEFRRRFPRKVASAHVLFYVTAPVQEVRLIARITHVRRDSPAALWRDFSRLAGVTRKRFDDYFDGQTEGIALILSGIRQLAAPLGLSKLRRRCAGFKPPRSLSVLPADSPLSRLQSALCD